MRSHRRYAVPPPRASARPVSARPTSARPVPVRTLVLVPMLALALALAGCGAGAADRPSATRSSYAPFGTVRGSVVPQAVTIVTHCDIAPGPVRATGTAHNPNSTARDLVVVVRWLLPGTGRTLVEAHTEVPDVAAGATVDWTVTARLPGKQTAECLPTVSLATPGGAPTGDPGGSP